MKILCIIFNNLKLFFLRETKIFIIMFLGLIIASFSLIYLYAYGSDIKRESEKLYNYTTRMYRLNIPDYKNRVLTANDFDEFFNTKLLPKTEEFYLNGTIKNNTINLVGFFSKREIFYVVEGNKFDDSMQKDNDDIAIVAVNMLNYQSKLSYMNDTYQLENINYKIIGVAGACPNNTVFVPFRTFLKNKYRVENISFVFKNQLNKVQLSDFINLINRIFPGASIKMPIKVSGQDLDGYYYKLLIFVLLSGFTIVNMFSLYKFWIQKCIDQFLVFRICGASMNLIKFEVLAEAIFLCIIPYMLGAIAYSTSSLFFKSLGIWFQISIPQLILCLTIFITFIIISTYKVSVKISKVTPTYKE